MAMRLVVSDIRHPREVRRASAQHGHTTTALSGLSTFSRTAPVYPPRIDRPGQPAAPISRHSSLRTVERLCQSVPSLVILNGVKDPRAKHSTAKPSPGHQTRSRPAADVLSLRCARGFFPLVRMTWKRAVQRRQSAQDDRVWARSDVTTIPDACVPVLGEELVIIDRERKMTILLGANVVLARSHQRTAHRTARAPRRYHDGGVRADLQCLIPGHAHIE